MSLPFNDPAQKMLCFYRNIIFSIKVQFLGTLAGQKSIKSPSAQVGLFHRDQNGLYTKLLHTKKYCKHFWWPDICFLWKNL